MSSQSSAYRPTPLRIPHLTHSLQLMADEPSFIRGGETPADTEIIRSQYQDFSDKRRKESSATERYLRIMSQYGTGHEKVVKAEKELISATEDRLVHSINMMIDCVNMDDVQYLKKDDKSYSTQGEVLDNDDLSSRLNRINDLREDFIQSLDPFLQGGDDIAGKFLDDERDLIGKYNLYASTFNETFYFLESNRESRERE